ncbi:MAG: hypothetical protein Q7R41_04060, partial [Phycisphaerales bacterium]|nr:hypothetical protein [Phycisphaerales bacterium]
MHSKAKHSLGGFAPMARSCVTLVASMVLAIGGAAALADKPVVKRAETAQRATPANGGVAVIDCTD